jgi:hypothetical protein
MLIRNIVTIEMLRYQTNRVSLAVIIMILGVAIAVSVSQAITLQSLVPAQERANQMLNLATSAMAKANQTLQHAYQMSIDPRIIGLAETSFAIGEDQLSLAIATFRHELPAPPASWGNVSLVNILALDALHSFHSVIDLIAQQWDNASLIPDWRSLRDTITRYEQYLEHVTATLQITQARYPNFDILRVTNYVSEAEHHLLWAATNLTRLAVNQTIHNLNAAQTLLGQINQELTALTASALIKGSQILQYIDETRHTLAEYQATALSLGINIEQSAATITANLDMAQQLTAVDAIEDAMPILRETHQLLLDLADEIAREKVINEEVNYSP